MSTQKHSCQEGKQAACPGLMGEHPARQARGVKEKTTRIWKIERMKV
jgi:hypothetical protein